MGTARIIQKGTFSRDELQAEMRVALGSGESALVSSSAD
jgi:hypothetical protein